MVSHVKMPALGAFYRTVLGPFVYSTMECEAMAMPKASFRSGNRGRGGIFWNLSICNAVSRLRPPTVRDRWALLNRPVCLTYARLPAVKFGAPSNTTASEPCWVLWDPDQAWHNRPLSAALVSRARYPPPHSHNHELRRASASDKSGDDG
jgi:hypothetical protein